MNNKNEVDVCCDVCNCVYNKDGCKCNREHIKITMDKNNEKAHFCDSYECKCGFMKE